MMGDTASVPASYDGRRLSVRMRSMGRDRALFDMLVSSAANGPYVHIGCNHLFVFCCTRWDGGGLRDLLARFERLYRKWRPGDRLVPAAVGEKSDVRPFNSSGTCFPH